MSSSIFVGLLGGGLLVLAKPATASTQLLVGKTARITLSQKVMLGDQILPPGHYKFEHQVQGAEHVVRFVPIAWSDEAHTYTIGPPKGAKPVEAVCKLQPLGSKVRQTEVYMDPENGAYHITKGRGGRRECRTLVLRSFTPKNRGRLKACPPRSASYPGYAGAHDLTSVCRC